MGLEVPNSVTKNTHPPPCASARATLRLHAPEGSGARCHTPRGGRHMPPPTEKHLEVKNQIFLNSHLL